MAQEFDAILDQVRKLLEQGKSLAITTIDTPWGDGAPSVFTDEVGESSIFKSEGGGRRCIQWVVLPTGKIECARYADD